MEIRWMRYKNQNGEQENFYPVTHAKAIVYGDNGNATFDDVVDHLNNTDIHFTVLKEVITLPVSGWNSSKTMTVNVSGVTSDNIVIVSSTPDLISQYGEAGCCCISQNTNLLEFKVDEIPTVDLKVNVVIMN